jgi:ureidoglycolate lyase
MMKLPILELTPATFAPYGKVIEMPQRKVDAAGPGWQWWGENVFLEGDARPYGIGYLDLEPADLRFDWAERHMRTVELIIPAGGDCLVYVGPPDHLDEPGRIPPLARFQVFRVRPGQGVLLDQGVWHGAPLALDRPLNAIVLLHQHTGQEDTTVVRFAETPVIIEKRLSD